MEYLAKIIKWERSKNKQLYRYTFIDQETGKEDYFLSDKRLSYIPNLVGKLKLELSIINGQQFKIYQSFDQIINPEEIEEEEGLSWWEEIFEEKEKKLDKYFTKRPIKMEHQDYVDFINILHYEFGISWKKIAASEKRKGKELTDRALRYRRENITKSLQKVGPKWKITRKDFYYLISFLHENDDATLKEMSDHLLEKTKKKFSLPTLFRVLEKIKYTCKVIVYRDPGQKMRLPEIIRFIDRVNTLPTQLILATDESGHPLNLTRKKGRGSRGQKVFGYKKTYVTNYSLILFIHNVVNKGVIHWDLVKETVDTDVFYNFLSNVKLPTDEKYYLLLDNAKFHKTIDWTFVTWNFSSFFNSFWTYLTR